MKKKFLCRAIRLSRKRFHRVYVSFHSRDDAVVRKVVKIYQKLVGRATLNQTADVYTNFHTFQSNLHSQLGENGPSNGFTRGTTSSIRDTLRFERFVRVFCAYREKFLV